MHPAQGAQNENTTRKIFTKVILPLLKEHQQKQKIN